MSVTKAGTVIRNAAGKPFSKWKPAEKFEWWYRENGRFVGHMVEEHQFNERRKFRFDFAWPEVKLGVEIDGFGYGHQAQQQMAADNEKANSAVLLGWRVLRFNTRQLGSKLGVAEAVALVDMVISRAE